MKKYSLFFIVLCVSINSFCQNLEWLPFKNEIGEWSFRSLEGEQLGNLSFDSVANFRLNNQNIEYFEKQFPLTGQEERYAMARVQKANNWGVISAEGKMIIPAIFDTISIQMIKGLIPLYIVGERNEKDSLEFGVYASWGELIVPIEFRTIEVLRASVYHAAIITQKKGTDNLGLRSTSGKLLLPDIYSEITNIRDPNYDFSKQGFLILKKNIIKKEKSFGVYSLMNECIAIPCGYNLGDINSSVEKFVRNGYQPDRNISPFILIGDKNYFSVLDKNEEFHFYNTHGDLLFNSERYSNLIESKPYKYGYGEEWKRSFFIHNDSIVASTIRNGVKVEKLKNTTSFYGFYADGRLCIYDTVTKSILDTSQYVGPFHFCTSRTSDGTKISWADNLIRNKEDDKFYFIDSLGKLNLDTISSEYIKFSKEKMLLAKIQRVKSHFEVPHCYKIHQDHKKGTIFVLRDSTLKKAGVVSENLETIIPMDYQSIDWKSEPKCYIVRRGPVREIYNDQGEKLKYKHLNPSKKAKSRVRYNDYEWRELVVQRNDKRIKLFNVEENKYVYSGRTKKKKRDSSHFQWYSDECRFMRYHQSKFCFQVFNPKKGWILYDDKGSVLFKPKEQIMYAMENIGGYNPILGVTYRIPFATNDKDEYKYHMLNGLRFENMDSAHVVNVHRQNENEYWVYSKNRNLNIFDTLGKKLLTCQEISHENAIGNDYVVRTESGLFAVDSAYNILLQGNFTFLRDYGKTYLGKKEGEYFVIKRFPEIKFSKPYVNLKIEHRKPLVAENQDGTFDIYNVQGDPYLENVEQIDDLGTYFTATKGNKEFWFTITGSVYGVKTKK